MITKPSFNKHRKLFLTVRLPQKTDALYAGFFFGCGHFDESSADFGLTHLLEHYLISKHKNVSKANIAGDVSLAATNILLETKNEDEIVNFFDFISNPSFTDEALLESEKKASAAEIYNRMHKTEEVVALHVLRHRVLNKIISRPLSMQLDNIPQFTLADLERRYETLKRNITVAAVVSYRAIKKRLHDFIAACLAEKFTLRKNAFPKPRYSSAHKKHIYISSIAEGFTKIILSFPAYTVFDPYLNRGGLIFLCNTFTEKMQRALRPLGIYHVSSERVTNPLFGMVFFTIVTPSSATENIIARVRRILYENLAQSDFDNITAFNERNEKLIKKDWDTNAGRLEWIRQDLSHFGNITNPKTVITSRITKASVKKVKNQIFKPEVENCLLFRTKR